MNKPFWIPSSNLTAKHVRDLTHLVNGLTHRGRFKWLSVQKVRATARWYISEDGVEGYLAECLTTRECFMFLKGLEMVETRDMQMRAKARAAS